MQARDTLPIARAANDGEQEQGGQEQEGEQAGEQEGEQEPEPEQEQEGGAYQRRMHPTTQCR